MTRVSLSKDESCWHLIVYGHAGYAAAGNDDVCAGISTLTFTLMNYIGQYDQIWKDITEIPPAIDMWVASTPEIDEIMNFVITGYRLIEEQYPEYIKVNT